MAGVRPAPTYNRRPIRTGGILTFRLPHAERAGPLATLRRALGNEVASIRQAAGGIVAASAAGGLAVAAVVPALLLRGLWATGAAGDSPFLLQRVQQYAQALGAGEFPARWMADAAYGLGYPFWNFYSPLAYLIAAPIALAGGGVVGAIKLVALASFVAAGLGAYVLGSRTWGSAPAGLVAAASYTFAPYHMTNLYVRGDALSELVAYALLPWVLVAFERAYARRSGAAVAGFALAVAALLLAHNVTALLFAPLAVAYALWRVTTAAVPAGFGGHTPAWAAAKGISGAVTLNPAQSSPIPGLRQPWRWAPWVTRRILQRAEARLWRRRPRARVRGAFAVAAGAMLGVALSAWFWLPALAERDAVHLDENVAGYFRFDAKDQDGELMHFRGKDLVPAAVQVDYDPGESCAPCRTGLVQVLVALAGAVAGVLAIRRGRRRITPGNSEGAGPAFPTAVITHDTAAGDSTQAPGLPRRSRGNPALGAPPWITSALLFWGVVALVATFMITPLSLPVWESVPLLEYAQFPWRWLSIQALGLAVVSGALGLAPARWLVAAMVAAALAVAALTRLPTETLSVDDVTAADLTTYELLTTNVGSSVRGEYLPVDADPRPWSGPAVAHGAAGEPRVRSGAITSPILWRDAANAQTWRLEVPGTVTATVAFPLLWFPGFQANARSQDALDGLATSLEVGPVEGSGWAAAQIPPGQWVVDLTVGRTGKRALAEGLSLMALAVCFALFVADRGLRLWRWALLIGASGTLCVALAWAMPVGADSGPVTMDMGRTPYPHSNPDGIRFGDSLLTSAILTPQEVNAGSSFTARLEWQNPWAGTVVNLALVAPAEPVYHVPDIAAVVEATQSAENDLTLNVPVDLPSGLYFLRLSLTNNGLAIEPAGADGLELGTVYLGPVRVVGDRTFREVPPNPVGRMGDVTLHEATLTQTAAYPDLAEVKLLWHAARPTLANYQTSVRLLDADGTNLVQEDKEPLYGFYPTTAWRAGEQVPDRRWLTLPPDLPTGQDYILEIVLYEAHTDRVLGTARVTGVRVTSPLAPLPSGGAPMPGPTDPGNPSATPAPAPGTVEPPPPSGQPAETPASPPALGEPIATSRDS